MQLGEIGTRKTVRAATAHCFGKVKIIDFDEKASVLNKHYSKEEIKKHFIISTHNNSENGFKNLLKELREDKKQFQSKPPYATLVIDTWTNFIGLCKKHITIQNSNEKRPSLALDSEINIEQMIQSDYGKLNDIQNFIEDFISGFPCNLIANFHIADQIDRLGNPTGKKRAAGLGRYVEQMPGRWMEVHRLFKHPVKREFLVSVINDGIYPGNSALPLDKMNQDGTLKDFDLKVFADSEPFCISEK